MKPQLKVSPFAFFIFTFWFPFLIQTHAQDGKKAQIPPSSVEIPFELTKQNNIAVKAKLNDREEVILMFHLAVSQVSLTTSASEKLKSVRWTETESVKSWGGETKSRVSRNNTLKIGSMTWDHLSIFQSTLSGRETAGKFGPDLFKNQAIEIDFRKNKLTIHSMNPNLSKEFQKIPLQSQSGMMFVEGTCFIGDQQHRNRFLIHTGYGGELLLDDSFAKDHQIDQHIEIIEEQKLKDSYGNVIKVKKGRLPKFLLGSHRLKNLKVGFFEGKVGRQKMSVIGAGLLMKFHIVISANRKHLFLKPY